MAHLAHYREAHPMPFVITHWINLVCMILLIVTGFSIHFPFWPAFMGIARGVHVFCGFILFINCIVRVIMACGRSWTAAICCAKCISPTTSWWSRLRSAH